MHSNIHRLWKLLSVLVILTVLMPTSLLTGATPVVRAETITYYAFQGVSQSTCNSNGICAHESDVDEFPYQFSNDRNSFDQPSNSEYGYINAIDGTRWTTADPGRDDYNFVQFDMVVNESLTSLTQINFTFVGYTDGYDNRGRPLSTEHRIYVKQWNQGDTQSGAWVQIGSGQDILAGTDGEMTRLLATNFASYINPNTGAITWGVYADISSESMYVNFVQMSVIADVAPENPSLIFPGAYVNTLRPAFSWNAATDPDDPAGDLSYTILIDSTEIDRGGNTSYTPTSDLGEGQHHWCVRAFDGFLYSSEWLAANCRDFTIDTVPPLTPGYLNEGNPDQDYSLSASDIPVYWGSVSDSSGVTYQLQSSTDDGQTWSANLYDGPASSFIDPGPYAENARIMYQVRACDGAGNCSSYRLSDGIRIDSENPDTVTGVGEGIVVGTDLDWSRDNIYNVYWSPVPDTGSGITYEVQRSRNNGIWENLTLSGLTCDATHCRGDDPTGYSNGDNIRYQVRAVTGAGLASPNWSTVSDGITIDLSMPDSSVTNGGIYNPITWPDQIAGSASDSGSGVTRVEITIYDSDADRWWDGDSWEITGPFWIQAVGATAWSYAFPESRLVDSHTYALQSRATDIAGNTETDYGANQFTYAARAPEAPVVTSTTHLDPNTWYNNSQPSFQWNEPASPIGIAGYSILLDQYSSTIPDKIQDTTQLTYGAATTPDGVWYFHVRAVDISGQWGPAGHMRVQIDTTTPQTPGSVTEENPDVDWDADGSVTVYWSAVPNTGSGLTYELQRSVNSGGYTFVISTTATSYAHNPGGYADGNTVRYRVQATSGVGLTGGWQESDGLTIDSQPPAQPAWIYEDAVSEPDRSYHNSANGAVTVHWDAVTDTGSSITYRLEKQLNSGSWTPVAQNLTTTQYPDSGSYNDGDQIFYRVTAVNGVGLTSLPAPSDGFVIDLGIPALPAWVREENPDIDFDNDGDLTVYWATVSDTGSGITYRLEKSVDDGAWQIVAENIADDHLADTNPAAPDGTHLRYRVTAVNGAGTAGAYRLSDGLTIDSELPADPAWLYENNPDVDFDADGAVWVNWAAVSNTGSGITYDLQKCIDAGSGCTEASWTNLTVSPSSATNFNDTATFSDETLLRYRVRARNGVGGLSNWVLSDGVRVDTGTPPQVTGVGEGDVVGTDDDYDENNIFFVYWTGVGPTATGDAIRYTVERNVNGSGWDTAVTGLTTTSWDDPQSYSNGDQVAYQVIAVNGAGTSGPVSAASDGLIIDTGRPNSTIATTGYYNAVNWPDRIEGSATDDYTGVAQVELTVYDSNTNLWWNGAAWAGGGPFWLVVSNTGNWQYALADTNLTDGHAYDLQSRAIDLAGNVETSYGLNSFIFAVSGPAVPAISSVTHPDQTIWYNDNDPSFTWTNPGGPAPIVGYSYLLDQNPGTTPDAVADTAGNNAGYTNQADGIWYFHVRALDNAGVWGPAGHYRINIDTTTPAAPTDVTEENPDIDWDFDGSVTVYWTAVTDTGSGLVYVVERQVGSGLWTVLSDTVSSTFYPDPTTGYADGTVIHFRVSARNGVGLTGLFTTSNGVTVDNDIPTTPAWISENGNGQALDEDFDPDGSVRVYWAAANNTGSGLTYRLERRITSGGVSGSWTQIANGLTAATYLDPVTHTDGDFVEYRVTAVNGVGSFNTPAASDGIRIDTDIPAAPAEVTENSPDIDWSLNGGVTVFWSSVAETGSGLTFRLEKQVNNGNWSLVANNLSGGTTSHPDSGSYNDGDFIRYRVRATNGAGTPGVWRESDGMTIDSSPVGAPGWVSEENPDIAYDADGALTVYWAAVTDTGSGITYRLEKELNNSGVWTLLAQNLAGTSYYDGQTQADGVIVRYRVTAVNSVGTAGSPTLSNGVTVDTQSPAAPAAPGEGDTAGTDDEFDQDNNFFVFWTAVAETGSGLTYDLQKSINGSSWVAAASGVAGTFWEDPVPYSNGDTVQYRVRTVTGAGLTGSWSGASNGLTMDFVRPDSAITTHGYYNAFNWSGFIFGTASDTGSDVALVDLTIQRASNGQYWNGSGWQSSAIWLTAAGTINWQYIFNPGNGETYDIRSRATDNAGNVETTVGIGAFTFAGTGPDAPVVSSATHPVQTNWYNDNDPSLTWTAPASSVPIVGYSYLLDQIPVTAPDTQADTPGTTVFYANQPDGVWYFHVRAQDEAGNWGATGHYRLNIDTDAPAAPAAVTEESPDVDWDGDGSVTVYWSAVADTGSGITYRLEQNLNNGGWTLVAGGLTGASRVVSGFANGDSVLFRVQALNGVGLSSGWTQSDGVSFDLTTPAAPATVGEGDVAGTDDDWDQDNNFFVFWTAVADAPSGITYSIERSRNSGAWTQVMTGLTSTFWEDDTAYSSSETVAYRVTAHTGAGHSSAASASSDGLTLDLVRPDSTVGTSGTYNLFTWPGQIAGSATDYNLSGVAYVDIALRRQADNLYWDGSAWVAGAVWLRASGTNSWQYAFTPEDGQSYSVDSRATDNAGNVQAALGNGVFSYISSEVNISLTDHRTTIQPGERITYTIAFSSPYTLYGGQLQVDVPTRTTYIQAIPTPATAGNIVVWQLGLLPAPVSQQRYLVVQIDPVLDNGTVISTSTLINSGAYQSWASDSSVIESSPNLSSSTAEVDNPDATPGEQVTYRIVLTNTGNMHAHQALVTDTIPAGLIYEGNLGASGGQPTYANGSVFWAGEVRVGTPVVISFTARISDTISPDTIIENKAVINDGFHAEFLERMAWIMVARPAPVLGKVYLPLIMNGISGAPPVEPGVELVIRNCGNVNAVGAFWVDLYFNPAHNTYWPISFGEGYDWFGQGAGFTVSLLGPGQSLALHLSDAALSNLPNPLPASAELYAQVDWFGTGANGVVNEGPNGEQNNVAGSGGAVCKATPGYPDLIVESIRIISAAGQAVEPAAAPATVQGITPAPARPQSPHP